MPKQPKLTAPAVRARKVAHGADPLVMVTAYDAPGARIADEAGVDVILVGDSLAMVVLGYDDTLQVTTEDLAVVGDVAHATDVAIHELRSEQTHLEELFFNLTESEEFRNRNLLAESGGAADEVASGLPSDLPPPSGPPVDPALLAEPGPDAREREAGVDGRRDGGAR